MLAPRKTLWSTPSTVVDRAIEWVGPLCVNDLVCDIGCGDGRCLIQWATHYSKTLNKNRSTTTTSTDAAATTAATAAAAAAGTAHTTASFVGIDIDAERIQQARQSWKEAVTKGEVNGSIHVEFYCTNALEAYDIFCHATIIFLYLIPRGLRKIKPVLERIPHPIQVITYMSPLPDEVPLQKEYVKVPHQPNAEWPVFAYRLDKNKG